MASGTVRHIKSRVKNRIKSARTTYEKTFRAFSPDELQRFLRRLGVMVGDTVFVHSSYDTFTGFAGKPTDAISTLQSLVSPRGILFMPTMPFTGTAVDYVAKNPTLELARTPSKMGLLTELFRRSPGVLRSVHPTHPIAAWGEAAAVAVADHPNAGTPCGRGSPFDQLIGRNGKVLLLGTDISSLTFYHWIEEALEPRLPQSPFTSEFFTLATRLPDNRIVETRTRLFEPSVSRRRNLHKLTPEIQRCGDWREGRLGGLFAVLLDAAQIRDAANRLADRAIYCYD